MEDNMNRNGQGRVWLAVVAAGVALAAAACGSSSSAATNAAAGNGAPMVTTRQNSSLGAKVLVNAQGQTLYTLSAERNGKFICTKTSTIPGSTTACTALWHPLIAHGAVTNSGVTSLGTVMRPDGLGSQVTYRGLPLYTFANDHNPGDASGNGFHDVGVWRAATVGTPAAGGGSTGGTSTGGGGYGYGY
jgi:predicted lipoprotein with Yx(FWY)xxD motif